jgi:hypothetical protein
MKDNWNYWSIVEQLTQAGNLEIVGREYAREEK